MSEETSMPKIGFIGTGVMGSSMAGHLIDAGYELNVYNRTASKCQTLIDRGAELLSSPGDVAAHSDIVITIVGFPRDVEQIYLDSGGIVERARSGALLIDMTTSDQNLAVRIYDAAKSRGIGACDAPVTGGDRGARTASLSIMVGGDAADFERAMPLFKAMGSNIAHFGPAGCGQTAKLANQIIIAGTMLGVCEGLIFAKRAGINPNALLECISSGSAGSWSLSNYGPRILRGDFQPGFFVKHFIKDMALADDLADSAGLDLKGLKTALEQYRRFADSGGAENGTQGLYKLYS
ncbi:MAG: NAD(P)-dependent oxidoreductase [Synergistaceae bacterium]|jgi:3-hydroxyisobutyrate dehydrogenase|nr:NAD(P)-dependent oxidoreductase [Synergistaceae bacterium]